MNVDQVWLQLYNEERQKENLGSVSGDLFESIIDQLEKEWFDLVIKKKKRNKRVRLSYCIKYISRLKIYQKRQTMNHHYQRIRNARYAMTANVKIAMPLYSVMGAI